MTTTSIKIDMTWTTTLPMLLMAYESGTATGRAMALEELKRMAAAADDAVRMEKEKPTVRGAEAHTVVVDEVDAPFDPAPYLDPEASAMTKGYVANPGWPIARRRPGIYRTHFSDKVTHDTILGFLARHYPERLAYMDETPDASQRDGCWMMLRCRERGLQSYKVAAPPILREQGFKQVTAWPVSLLKERFAS